MYDFRMDKINATCPNCGNEKYMYHMSGINVGSLNMKCTNCNSYFTQEEISAQSEFYKENDDLISRQKEQKEPCLACESLENGDTLYFMSDWDGGIGFDYIRNIKYCPVCGRKL